MSWADVEDAVQSAIAQATGFPDKQVAWSYQNIGEPLLPHATITFGGAITIGIDRVETTTDLSRAPGQEIKVEIKGVREVPLELAVFTPDVVGDAAARHIAELARTKLRLPSIRYGLLAVGLSPFDPGPVNWVPDIPSAAFRGRAVCTVRCYVPVMDCLEYAGYIARVRGTVVAQAILASGPTGYSFAFDTNSAP